MKGTIKSKERITELFSQGSTFQSAGFLALYSFMGKKSDFNDGIPELCGHKVSDSPALPTGKIAFIAGKKLGAAPLRSRAKRRLREAVRVAGGPWDNYDVALVAKQETLKKDFATLVSDLKRLGRVLGSEREETQSHENPNSPHNNEIHQNLEQERDSYAVLNGQKTSVPHTIIHFIIGIPRNIALLCIKVYRHAISPLLPPSCRYVPTCSEYALIAFKRFGFWKGLWLSVKRVGRCHPFVEGGYDPVPEALK